METNYSVKDTYEMKFDIGTIKHLGLQMYSTLPPVIGELVANGWDANATRVEITIPDSPLNSEGSEIVIKDNGIGMSDRDIREKYMVAGRDRRESEGFDETPEPLRRKVMGRKGIGKFSSFGIAKEIEVESCRNGEISRFVMNYDEMLENSEKRVIEFPSLPPTNTVNSGTKITLRKFTKFRTQRIQITRLRRGLARRFSVIGAQNDFEVVINGAQISPEERNLQALLDKDAKGNLYIWNYDGVNIANHLPVSGWIGALDKTSPNLDGIDRGIVLMARGKLVQEPFVFEANVGQQYALSYIIGELHVEFVDEAEDTIGTNRNALVWDTDANAALKEWGQREVNKIARDWAKRRSEDNQKLLEQDETYQDFKRRAEDTGNKRALNIADKLVRKAIDNNPTASVQDIEPIIDMCLTFLEFDVFWEIASEMSYTDLDNPGAIFHLFREWQIIEAKEMMKVTEGRIKTIEKLQKLIEENALEVPTLHNFLKEFPWVIDPRWTLVDDEVSYSSILRKEFIEGTDVPEKDKRIDFLCVRDGTTMTVVEIKRPGSKISKQQLDQIEEYVSFMRNHVANTTDPEFRYTNVVGYLLCGDMVDTYQVREKRGNLAQARIFVKQYSELLSMAQRVHRNFIERYNRLKETKSEATV